MNRLLSIAATALLIFGIAAIVYPFASVASLTAQVLDEVPRVPGADVSEDRNVVSALWNDGFVLATRTYESGVDEQATIDALGEDFELGGFSPTTAWAKSCCGAYDAVLVSNQTTDDGTVRQSISVFDSNIQFAWLLMTFVGLLLIAASYALFRSRPNTNLATTDLPVVESQRNVGSNAT